MLDRNEQGRSDQADDTGPDVLIIGGRGENAGLAAELSRLGQRVAIVDNNQVFFSQPALQADLPLPIRRQLNECRMLADPAAYRESFLRVLRQDSFPEYVAGQRLPAALPAEDLARREREFDEYRSFKISLLSAFEAASATEEQQEELLAFDESLLLRAAVFEDGVLTAGRAFCSLAYELIADHESRERSQAERDNSQGHALNQAAQFEEAITYFDAALRESPRYCLPLVNKGIALKRMNRFDEAIECYDRALEIDPGYKKALHNKGIALLLKGCECLGAALEIDPNYQLPAQVLYALKRAFPQGL